MEGSRCRICLTEEKCMQSILDTKLQYVYERLSQYLLVTGSKPLVVCYICHAQLKNAQQLMIRCCKSEEILAQMLNGLQDGHSLDGILPSFNSMVVTPVVQVNIEDHDDKDGYPYLCDFDDIQDRQEVEVQQDSTDQVSSIRTWPGASVYQPWRNEERGVDGNDEMEVNIPENQHALEVKVKIEKSDEAWHHSDPLEDTLYNSDRDHFHDDISVTKFKAKKKVTVRKSKRRQKGKPNEGNTTREPITNRYKLKTKKTKKMDSKIIIATHTDEKKTEKFLCHLCGKGYRETRYLNNHIRTHTGERPFECKHCYKGFTSIKLMKSHLKSHSKEKPYSCDICPSTFKHKKHIKIHKRRLHACLTNPKPFQCNVCQKSFRSRHNLKNHIGTHGGEKRYQCDICSRSYYSKQALINHIRTHTGDSYKPHKCHLCSKCFRSPYDLKSHLISHSDEKPYTCGSCHNKFKYKQSLESHRRIHAGLKPHICEICQQRFRDTTSLKYHMFVHTGEKRFRCDICQSGFTRKDRLETHMRLHTGEKPYKCAVCLKRFRLAEYYTNHMRMHTGEKPFQCATCAKYFRQRTHLDRHLLTHTGLKPYKCETCQKSFNQLGNMRTHQRLHNK